MCENTCVEPPSMKEAVAQFIRGRIPTGTVAAAILLNTVVMYIQLQWLGSIANASLGLEDSVGSWGPAEQVFNVCEIGFGIFFLLEFLLNVFAFRWEYFRDALNFMDSTIVLITSLEIFVLQPFSVSMGNISFLRVLRLAKFARTLRIVRTMSVFSKFRILLSTVAYSMGSFFWSMVLLFLLMLMAAIFLCQVLHDFVIDKEADFATRTWVNDRFGSGNKALYTLFEITFSGGWPTYISTLVTEVNPFYAVFVFFYVTLVVFGMIRIISALFLSETLQQANRDSEIMVMKNAEKGKRMKNEISALFDAADTSGDGLLSFQEMDDMLSHQKVRAWLAELGVNPEDTQMLFDLLDDGDGQVDKDEFVVGITKLKGEARAQDLIPVVTNCQRILAHCKVMRHTVEAIAASMGKAAPPLLVSLSAS